MDGREIKYGTFFKKYETFEILKLHEFDDSTDSTRRNSYHIAIWTRQVLTSLMR